MTKLQVAGLRRMLEDIARQLDAAPASATAEAKLRASSAPSAFEAGQLAGSCRGAALGIRTAIETYLGGLSS